LPQNILLPEPAAPTTKTEAPFKFEKVNLSKRCSIGISKIPNKSISNGSCRGSPFDQPDTNSGKKLDSPTSGMDFDIGKSKGIVFEPQIAIALAAWLFTARTLGNKEIRSPGSTEPRAKRMFRLVIKALGIPESDWLVAIRCTPSDRPLAAIESRVPIAKECELIIAGSSSASTIIRGNSSSCAMDATPAEAKSLSLRFSSPER